jgi:hypothetical protein
MSVPSRHLLGESLAEFNEQIHEVVIRIAPVYVSKIDYGRYRVILYQNMVSATISVEHCRSEQKILGSAQIDLKLLYQRVCF